MMKHLLFATVVSLPLLAQQEPLPPQEAALPSGGVAASHGDPHRAAFMEKFDTNKDGRIDEQEKQAIRQAHEARKAEFQKKLLEKYDANKDGQLDDQEKAAIKADFEKNCQGRRHMRHGGHGPAMPPPCCCGGKNPGPPPAFMERFDTNKDGQIDEQEKQAIREAREARKAEFQKKLLEKYDANKDGQLDDQEKAAIKADFEKNCQGRRHMRHGGHGPAMPPPCCCGGKNPGPPPAFMERFDTNKDGQIDEQEKQAIREAREARKAEFQKKLLEKYDANKDGQLDDQEKAAIKADFEKNCQGRRHMRHGGHGPVMPPPCCCPGRGHGPHPHGPNPPCDVTPESGPETPPAPSEQ